MFLFYGMWESEDILNFYGIVVAFLKSFYIWI